MTKSKEVQRKIKAQYFYIYPFFGIFLILLSSFGLLIILESVNRNEISNDFLDFIRVASVIIMLCVMNIIPGVIFLILHSRTSLTNAGYGALGLAIGALIIMASVMTSIFPLIINRTMTFIGIADWKERIYIIDSTQFPENTFVKDKWKFEKTTLKDRFIVHGVMVYSLNNTKLLCPAEIRNLYNDRIHFVPWSEHYDADVAKKLINYSSSCQPFIKGGVRRLSAG